MWTWPVMTEVTFLMYTSLIMRPLTYSAQDLVSFLRREKIATISQLKDALGTSADATVFRKLKELSYRTSYSHRGGYYTLDEIARFSELGLWSFREVWFSQYGTLLSTARGCVNESVAGYFADELQEVLHVEVRTPVLKLVREAPSADRSPEGGGQVPVLCIRSCPAKASDCCPAGPPGGSDELGLWSRDSCGS